MPSTLLNLAHRGANTLAPENTLAAFAAAMRGGADGVELDIHETGDGCFVVHHDADIAGRPIAGSSRADLSSSSGASGTAPGLDLALDLLAGFPATVVFMEIKGMCSWTGLRRLVDPYRGRLDLRIMSFDLGIMRQAAADPGGFPLGIIAHAAGVDPVGLLERHGAGLLSLRETAVRPALVEQLHGAGRELFAWTVNDRGRMRELADMKVDGLISDRPDLVKVVLAG